MIKTIGGASTDFGDFRYVKEAAHNGNMLGGSGELWTALIPALWQLCSGIIPGPTAFQGAEKSEKLKSMVDERTKELEAKTDKLEEINVALNVLLEKREEDKILLQEHVLSNVKKLAIPYMEKIKKGKLTETQIALLDVLESNLHEIISPFSLKLSSNSFVSVL